MTRLVAAALMLAGLALPGPWSMRAMAFAAPAAGLTLATRVFRGLAEQTAGLAALALGALALLPVPAGAGAGVWIYLLGLTLLLWVRLVALPAGRHLFLASPVLFGLAVVYLWEVLVVGFEVPRILLPAPSQIGRILATRMDVLWPDFEQTFLKSVLSGFAIGCGSGFAAAILVDRVPFLQRGLLPLSGLVSAMPIVGIAPIMVMWFGFDWQSKAAVVVVMTFFPMLVNTLAGLAAADAMQRDLMHSYAASYAQTLLKLRLPAALPFVFNALKINSTLALIGAIVAEFFGSPIYGLGFRISAEVARMNVDVVWAVIAIAALAGSMFYFVLAALERALTFWHPSYRT
jgi:NitT/TauT family transport system permease protein